MGLFSGLAKAGLAKKAITEARKPQNQRRAMDLFNRLRGNKSTTTRTRTRSR
ncbi:MAG TPA: hypothetical protein VEZ46_04470 [Mycobacteriales bacterium]|jgi:hypothetical protein|nr:hypothetical protein [Mycobacteriales bacterium]